MASSSSPSLSPLQKSSSVSDNADEEGKQELQGKIRGHEVAISELKHLQPSRHVTYFGGNSLPGITSYSIHNVGQDRGSIPEEWQYLFSPKHQDSNSI